MSSISKHGCAVGGGSLTSVETGVFSKSSPAIHATQSTKRKGKSKTVGRTQNVHGGLYGLFLVHLPFKEILQLANQRIPSAMFHVGSHFFEGKDCKKNPEKGLGWLVEAAGLNNPLSTNYLSKIENFTPAKPGQFDDMKLAKLELYRLTSLQSLYLSQCHQITDRGFISLDTHTNLRLLDLSDCNQITDSSLQHLATFKGLKTLGLCGCKQLTDRGIHSLATLTALQTLGLGDCYQITDRGVKSLALLTNLHSLGLFRCNNITDVGIKSLAFLTNLQWLCLCCCSKISDKGVKSLCNLTKLQVLNITGCEKITNAGKSLFRPDILS